jgi:carbon storage regulator
LIRGISGDAAALESLLLGRIDRYPPDGRAAAISAPKTNVGFPQENQASREALNPMLVLTRKSNQSIMIGDDIEVSVLAIMGEKVRVGIQAPRDIPVFRKEVYLEIQQERGDSSADAREEVDAALRGMGADS